MSAKPKCEAEINLAALRCLKRADDYRRKHKEATSVQKDSTFTQNQSNDAGRQASALALKRLRWRSKMKAENEVSLLLPCHSLKSLFQIKDINMLISSQSTSLAAIHIARLIAPSFQFQYSFKPSIQDHHLPRLEKLVKHKR